MVLDAIVSACWLRQIEAVETRKAEALVRTERSGRAQTAATAIGAVTQIGTDHPVTADNLQQVVFVTHEVELADFLLGGQSATIVVELMVEAIQITFDRLGERCIGHEGGPPRLGIRR